MSKTNITVAGLDYISLANAVLLANYQNEPNNLINAIMQANRLTADLQDVANKVYTRDIFGQD